MSVALSHLLHRTERRSGEAFPLPRFRGPCAVGPIGDGEWPPEGIIPPFSVGRSYRGSASDSLPARCRVLKLARNSPAFFRYFRPVSRLRATSGWPSRIRAVYFRGITGDCVLPGLPSTETLRCTTPAASRPTSDVTWGAVHAHSHSVQQTSHRTKKRATRFRVTRPPSLAAHTPAPGW